MKKWLILSTLSPLVIIPPVLIASCAIDESQIDNNLHDFQANFLRKKVFEYQDLDLPINIDLAIWTIDQDWLWNQKLDQIFYKDQISKHYRAIWDLKVEKIATSGIKGLKVNVQFMIKGSSNPSPTFQFKIQGFS